MRSLRVQVPLVISLAVVLSGSSAAAAQTPPAGQPHEIGSGLRIEVVSSPKPSLVTGGDALIRLDHARALAEGAVLVSAGRRDVSNAFVAQPDGSLLGLVTDLPPGNTTLVARPRRGGGTGGVGGGAAVLHLRNHPITGPVFSGEQQLPFFCETEAFGLAPAQPPSCAAPTVVRYVYRRATGGFAALADPTSLPPDVAQATVDGRSVPYVVRHELGTIDRAVYEIAALYDGAEPSPTRSHGAWNRRLIYTFGGGCNVGYHQGASTGGVLNDLFLARGYAVASSSLNVLDNNCSPVISAEVAMMVKEHVVEEYGPVAHTIGWGGSGGAIQQYQIADNYPGILDGIVPQASFPDPTTTGATVADCRLLNRYFAGSALAYTPQQRNQISGYVSFGSCVNWDLAFAGRVNATEACPSAVPVGERYDPVANPDGIKCTIAEQLVNQLGRDRRTGFARSYLDNEGVQYGLAALTSGQITPEQFVDLNEKIGGYDIAGTIVGERSVADQGALVRAYRSGLVTSGAKGLSHTPIIDLRAYTDSVNDIHTRFWSFTVRQRLMEANGTADNHVILTAPLAPIPADPALVALDGMERWLTAIAADDGAGSAAARAIRNRPADVADGCFTPAGARITEPAEYAGTGQCDTLYPAAADTRIAAGAPLRNDVLKCRLRPLDFRSYPVDFTPQQRDRLRSVFDTGVCDYGRRGVGQVPVAGTWQSY